VLATGDEVFRAKSKARVLDLVRQAKGVVFVTHDMNWVVEFCNRAILLQHGRIVAEGDPAEVVAIHKDHSRKARAEREAAIARALDSAGGATLPPDAAGSPLLDA
jgi:ABC-type polysaccharide/polyol phosphate transport system ATPase subunit